MNISNPAGPIADKIRPTRTMFTWMANVSRLASALSSSGTTADRPTDFLFIGRTYFDVSLGSTGKPVWYDGTQWIDAAGTAV